MLGVLGFLLRHLILVLHVSHFHIDPCAMCITVTPTMTTNHSYHSMKKFFQRQNSSNYSLIVRKTTLFHSKAQESEITNLTLPTRSQICVYHFQAICFLTKLVHSVMPLQLKMRMQPRTPLSKTSIKFNRISAASKSSS